MSKDGHQLAPSTVAVYCAGWRSFQAYMLDMERVNEIQATFKVRPVKFVTEENGIAVKRHKLNAARPKAWALTPTEIDAIDQQFAFDIKAAYAARSKSLLPLQRDRVMFHIAIHFALRVSELVTIQLHDFKASHDPRMKAFQNFGTLTITGKMMQRELSRCVSLRSMNCSCGICRAFGKNPPPPEKFWERAMSLR